MSATHSLPAGTALVYGLAVAGASTVRALVRHGVDVLVADDTITPERSALARDLGVELIDGGAVDPDELLASCTLLCPAPGVPETHRIIESAQRRGITIVSEIELAYRWEQERAGGPRPMLAVTGTDGKTSTTKMAVAMLAAAGVRSVDAGNTDTPLVDAIEMDLDAFVVECSSFRLAWTPTFRADAAAWLNLEPDHLNWHRSMESYERAKAQIFANQMPSDVAIGFAPDAHVMGNVAAAPGRSISFGLDGGPTGALPDYRLENDELVGPTGAIALRSDMRRSLPHDITNALASAALVLESGLATPEAVARALADFVGPPHRLELIGSWGGVDWFNDSKATTPHAAAAAIRSFERLVLIAGGADKGVDLAPMADEIERVQSVIAIGTTGPKIADTFGAVGRVEVVETLQQAVPIARTYAQSGDTVLLSPGCASLDQFANFEVRGDTFRSLVLDLMDDTTSPGNANNSDIVTTPARGAQ